MIHCSLGKDRTGVICALILSLCGVQDSIVAHEYALTALGIEDKVASIITEIRPNGPGISEEEERFFSSRLVFINEPVESVIEFLTNMEAESRPCKPSWNGLGATAGWRGDC